MAIVLAISLPLQVVAAYAMPLCAGMEGTAPAMTQAAAIDHASMGCEHAKQANAPKPQPGHQCDKCFACYLAFTPAITPSVVAVADYGIAATLPPVLDKIYHTVTSPPFHPPRPSLA